MPHQVPTSISIKVERVGNVRLRKQIQDMIVTARRLHMTVCSKDRFGNKFHVYPHDTVADVYGIFFKGRKPELRTNSNEQ